MKNPHFIKQTASTNALLREMMREHDLPDGFVLYTDFQTAGKGQIGNSWESADGENLLFSMVLYPQNIDPTEQFLLSQLVSLGIKKTLDEFTDGISIKWPNDIYWNDKKTAGILIENVLQGRNIKHSILGVGVNVNQLVFESNAPNPVSLHQITGKSQDRKTILDKINKNINDLYKHLDKMKIRKMYSEALYRKEGYFTFKDENNTFQARIIDVYPDGKLELETTEGEYHGYYFKEVSFVI
jgi:BirA family biotin operon repressor/biotin-[acetyl-CoA-carboxylase] ligase